MTDKRTLPKNTRSTRLLPYGVALLSVVLALGITQLLLPWLYPTITPLFFVAVMVSAWYGGLRAGLLATILSTLAINYFLSEPIYSFHIANVEIFVRLSTFLMAASLISSLNQSRRNALKKSQEALQTLKEAMEREQEAWTEAQITKEQLEKVLSSINDGVYVLDHNWRFTYVNDRYCEMSKMGRSAILGQNVWDLFPAAIGTEVDVQFRRAIREQIPLQFDYLYSPWNSWYDHRIYPSSSGLTVFLADITERKQAELMLVEQKRLLELIASGQPLDDCLSALCDSVSRLNPGTRACFLLADAQRRTFPRSIAPDLPSSFSEELKDAPINDLCIGTCGEAVYRGQPITCADIANDDRWSQSWRDLCLAHGILACHSKPVMGIHQRPFGSLMLCFDEARMPTDWEYQLAEFGVQVASIVFERERSLHVLRESEEQFRTLTDNMSQLAWMTDATGWISWYNQRWFEYTGTTLEDMQGWGWQQVHHPDHVERVVAHFRHSIETGESWEDTFPLRGQDGTYHWFLSRALPIKDYEGRILRWFGTNTNITERRQNQLQLQEQAQQLMQLNADLRQSSEILAKRNQELDQFVYVVSHDLKAPLRAIANLSQWLEDDLKEQLPEENQHQMELLRQRVHRLEDFIDGLLAYSRVGRTEVAEETVSIGELLCEILDSLAPPVSFTIKVNPPMPFVVTKRLLLTQVFSNLISNAIKHHHRPDGQIIVSATEKGDGYEFIITDDGPGIAPEHHEKIFGIFQTLQASNTKDSTGIGLSIVKKILETEGGAIVLESELGMGTTFRFTWPKQPKTSKDEMAK